MKYTVVWYISFLIYHAAASDSVFIVIHGTWAFNSTWYKPGGDFFEALVKSAQEIEGRVVPFSWSGSISIKDRKNAAEELICLIESYQQTTSLFLVAHSHGANVGLQACRMLGQKKSSHRIQSFFALGVPVQESLYFPNMSIIEYLYNFFSYEDLVQPVFGLYQREFSFQPRIANIRIMVDNKEPTHEQLHSPVIAQWIPFIVMNSMIDTVSPYTIHFQNGKEPCCIVDEQREILQIKDKAFAELLLNIFKKTYINSRLESGNGRVAVDF